jgi:hypothetical protein
MTVSLTVSDIFPVVLGSNISDAILGGGGSQTGWNVGPVTSGQWGPITDKVSNLGHKDLYLSHDGTNEITELTVFVDQFGTNTGYTYGGSATAASDYSGIKAQGSASGSSKNNADNASAGLWMDMQWDVSDVNRFDIGSRSTLVKTFGKSSAGIDIGSAFAIAPEAMVYNSGGETAASAPESGKIGPAANTVLGDTAHLQFRHYMEQNPTISSFIQYELVWQFSFTS